MKLNWNFQRSRGGIQTKNTFHGGDIFWNDSTSLELSLKKICKKNLTSCKYLSCAKTGSLPLKHVCDAHLVVPPQDFRRKAPRRELQGILRATHIRF